ncbi:MAG TPA: hypothetical protein VF179_28340 [Thermoanaerobaculia bacterium]|nr:hypothetical protein [Thermoanaerobaculia bacterium]
MSRSLTLLLVALVPICGAAQAQQATLTLSHETVVWDDEVEARIEGVGCSGEFETAVHFLPWAGWIVDIDLLHCDSSSTMPFSTVVKLGRLFPQDYTVQLQNWIRFIVSPPPPAFDTAKLKVAYHEASLDVVLPEVATDAAPFTLTYRGPASTTCFFLDPPVVEGNAITQYFSENCPVLPIPGPHIFEREFQVGPLAAGEYEIRFISLGEARPRLHRQTLIVHDADRCVPSDTALCLQGGRFRIEVDWKDFQDHAGKGHPIPLAGQDDSGLVWFFKEENIELTVKVLNGCALGDNFWVFLSSGSTVEHTVTVTDTRFGRKKTYTNDRGEAAPLIADTAAFSCDR